MIIINNIKMPLETDFSNIAGIVADKLKIGHDEVISAELYRKSVDARHKNDVKFCCSVKILLKNGEEKILKRIKNAQIFKE